MHFLKNNLLLSLIFLSACGTSGYKITKQDGDLVEFRVSADRIISVCDKLETSDRGWVSWFAIYVLDDENTVLTFANGSSIDHESCHKHQMILQKVLSQKENIYIAAGFGDELQKPRIQKKYTQVFPKHGTFHENGRSLNFNAIANDKGACLSAYNLDLKPCPDEPFPLK